MQADEQGMTNLKALAEAVAESGGPKKVACFLWPEKSHTDKDIDSARRRLCATLDEDRDEKLSIDEIAAIFGRACEHGFHDAFEYFAAQCGYVARPKTAGVAAFDADAEESVIGQLRMQTEILQAILENSSVLSANMRSVLRFIPGSKAA